MFLVLKLFHLFHYGIFRQRREHRVFQALLQMVPGLKERLLDGSDNDVKAIAELVGHGCSIAIQMLYLPFKSFRKACLVLGRTTRKA
jgi:hypothetical protein